MEAPELGQRFRQIRKQQQLTQIVAHCLPTGFGLKQIGQRMDTAEGAQSCPNSRCSGVWRGFYLGLAGWPTLCAIALAVSQPPTAAKVHNVPPTMILPTSGDQIAAP